MRSFLFMAMAALALTSCDQSQWTQGPAPSTGLGSKIFSLLPDVEGSLQIFPATNTASDRWTFFVSRNQNDLFNTPLTIPGRETPIGYAAQPTQNEECPSIATPEGFHWVKVWVFGADAERDYLTVVTPPSVLSRQMADSVSGLAYSPVRFKSDAECVSGDPLLPAGPNDCNLRNAIRYQLSVASPVCAIQPL